MNERSALNTTAPLLDFSSLRGLLHNALLLASAWALPALAHLIGAPVLWLLPMHWPVILAGLLYGWRGGLSVGLLAPLLSLALSGRPAGIHLALMTAELGVYGLVAGLAAGRLAGRLAGRERLRERWGVLTALVGGRLVYALGLALSLGGGDYYALLGAALLPGLPAAAAMFIVLPPLARRLRSAADRDGD